MLRLPSALVATAAILFASAAPAGAALGVDAAPDTDGVAGRVAGANADEKEQVRDVLHYGGRTYAVGLFTSVSPAGGLPDVAQPFIAAYDTASGKFVESFRPQANGPILEVAIADDGSRLLIGGSFTEVNGEEANGVAALDPQTGALQRDWDPELVWRYASGALEVDALEVSGSSVYIGGRFSDVGDQAMQRLARVSLADGSLDESWTPSAQSGKVASLTVDGDRVYVGGSFRSVNNIADTDRFAALNTVDGELVTGVAQGQRIGGAMWTPTDAINGIFNRQTHYPYQILRFDDYVAWAGDKTVVVLNRSDLSEAWRFARVDECALDGDAQALAFLDGMLYVGGHFDFSIDPFNNVCGANPATLFRWDPATGEVDTSFRPGITGAARSIWALEVDAADSLWLGGVFGGVGATSVDSLARLDQNGVVPAPGDPVVSVASVTDSTATLSWDAVNGAESYTVSYSKPGTQAQSTSVTGAEIELSDLDADSLYVGFVQAVGVDGQTSSAVAVSFRTLPIDVGGGDGDGDGDNGGDGDGGDNGDGDNGGGDGDGDGGDNGGDNGDGTNPSDIAIPTNLAVKVSLDDAQVTLDFQPTTDETCIYRSEVLGERGTKVDCVTSASTYVDVTAVRGVRYFYSLTAVSGGVESWRSGQQLGGLIDLIRPDVPTGLKAVDVTDLAVKLQWNDGVDNVGVVEYVIYRSEVAGELGEEVGRSDTTGFVDLGLTAETEYHYYLKAYDAAGNLSWRTGFRTVTTLDPQPIEG